MLLILSQSSEQPRLFDSEFRLLGNTGRSWHLPANVVFSNSAFVDAHSGDNFDSMTFILN